MSIKEKIEAIVTKVYGGKDVNFTANAEKQIKTLTDLGFDKMPICMAKTQYSLTDDATKLGAPTASPSPCATSRFPPAPASWSPSPVRS